MFSKRKQPDYHTEAHLYAADIQSFAKLRNSAMQRAALQPTEANRAEVAAFDNQMAIMLKTMQQLTKRGIESDKA